MAGCHYGICGKVVSHLETIPTGKGILGRTDGKFFKLYETFSPKPSEYLTVFDYVRHAHYSKYEGY